MDNKNRFWGSKFIRILLITIITIIGTLITYACLAGADKSLQLDGQIVFINWKEQIMILDVKSGRVLEITKDGRNFWPKWSPDGQKIAFASIRGEHKNREIYVIDADGKNLKRLTHTKDGNASDPRWNFNGKILFFQSTIKGNIQENSIELITGEIKTIIGTGGVGETKMKERLEKMRRIFQVFQSPNGRYQVLFYKYEPERKIEFIDMDTDSKKELKTTNPGQPSWSKDSRRIAYVTGYIPNQVLAIFNVEENKFYEIKLPSGPETGCGGELSWNRNSSRIVYSCGTPYSEKEDSRLYILDLETKKSSMLIKGSSPDWH